MESEEALPEGEEEIPLDLTIAAVDVLHGGVRLRATMSDGSADVAVLLGGPCERREVGRGVATRLSLDWLFDENDIASAVRCKLVVRARSRVGGCNVRAEAPLAVTPNVVRLESDDASEGPSVRELTAAEGALRVAFAAPAPARALVAGDCRILPLPPEVEHDETQANRFDVPYEAFARALVEDRPLRLDGTAFRASLAIGGVALERDDLELVSAGAETEQEGVGEAK